MKFLRHCRKNYERAEGEEEPIAIILCADKSKTMTELMELGNSGINVAQYLTNYVPKELIQQRFLQSIKKCEKTIRTTRKN